VPKLARFAKPNPARQYHLARRGTARSLQFAQPGKPAFPRSCSPAIGVTCFAHHVMPRGRGWTNREYAYLAQAYMENIRESNPRHGPDKSGPQGGSVQILLVKNTLYKDRDSRAEQYIRGCMRHSRWRSSKFAAILARPFVG
jgi:hypothetical protein